MANKINGPFYSYSMLWNEKDPSYQKVRENFFLNWRKKHQESTYGPI